MVTVDGIGGADGLSERHAIEPVHCPMRLCQDVDHPVERMLSGAPLEVVRLDVNPATLLDDVGAERAAAMRSVPEPP